MLPQKHCNINLTGPIPRWDEAIPLGNGILGLFFGGRWSTCAFPWTLPDCGYVAARRKNSIKNLLMQNW